MIRDDLLKSERYWSCSPEARNLFVSIVLSADDTARAQGSAWYLRTHCMAGTVSNERAEKLLSELQDCDLVRVYQNDGARYLFIPRFKQRLRYVHSKYPEPPNEINDLVIKKTDSSQSQDRPKSDSSQSEVKRSEEKRSKAQRGAPISPDFGISENITAWALKNHIFNLERHFTNFVDQAKAKAYRYSDWDAALRKAITQDWAKIGKGADPAQPKRVAW